MSEKIKLLIVDDNKSNNELVSKALESDYLQRKVIIQSYIAVAMKRALQNYFSIKIDTLDILSLHTHHQATFIRSIPLSLQSSL